MTDEEIRSALVNFPEVWRRVSGEEVKLPEGLVLMPGKDRNSHPARSDFLTPNALYSTQDFAILILVFSILICCLQKAADGRSQCAPRLHNDAPEHLPASQSNKRTLCAEEMRYESKKNGSYIGRGGAGAAERLYEKH